MYDLENAIGPRAQINLDDELRLTRNGTGSVSGSVAINGIELLEQNVAITQGELVKTKAEMEEEMKRKRETMLRKPIPVIQQLRAVLFPSWYINWLLLAVPVGIGIKYVHGINPLAVFIVNFLAIIPLAGILGFSTEELALRIGETRGGLLNATFGNAVELIIGIIALAHKEIVIVQTSLIGSMLSNLLLVLGMCFYFGGLNRIEQFFNETVAQTASSLLFLATAGLIIPTVLTLAGVIDPSKSNIDEKLSRSTAIILLIVYASYLIFQLKSHKEMCSTPSPSGTKRRHSEKDKRDVFKALVAIVTRLARWAGWPANQQIHDQVADTEEPSLSPQIHDQVADTEPEEPSLAQQIHNQVADTELEEPSLSLVGSLVTLCITTALIGVCAEFLVDSINSVTCQFNLSEYFIGLILLPIIGNATEHATALTVAIKDKMDLAVSVAVGSSLQIALLVLPLMVVLGWIIHSDMTLIFDVFQIAILFSTVLLVNYLIGDAKSHWLEGELLIALYLIIASAAWFYPLKALGECS